MAERRQKQLEDLKEPKNIAGLIIITARLEAKLRDFQLEAEGFLGNDVTVGHNKRGEEVERKTGYVHPLPPSE